MTRSISRLLPWAPLLLAAVYLVTLVASQGMVRASLNREAGLALGWQLIPFALWLATAALAGAAVWRASSAWAGAVTASLIVCGGVAMRGTLWSLTTHGPVAAHVALLGAALVGALMYPQWQRGVRGYGAAVAIGLITAVGATDPLLVPLGIVPLLLAAFALAIRRHEATLLRLAVLVSALGVVGAEVLPGWAEAAGITRAEPPAAFLAGDRVVDQFGLLPASVARLVSTNPFGAELDTTTVIAMLGALIGLGAALAVSVTGVRLVKRTLWPQRFGRSAAGTVRGGRIESAVAASLVFWLAVLAASVLAFIVSSTAPGVDSARALVPGWVAVAVLIPLLAERLELRWLGATTATALCFAATYALVDQPRSSFEAAVPSRPGREAASFTSRPGSGYQGSSGPCLCGPENRHAANGGV